MLNISISENFPKDKRKIGRITTLPRKPSVREIPTNSFFLENWYKISPYVVMYKLKGT